MARLDPWNDVLRRRYLLPAFGTAEGCFSMGKGFGRCWDHHGSGTGSRASVKPAVSDMGLPEHTAELPWADLSAVLPFVDAGRACRHGTVPPDR